MTEIRLNVEKLCEDYTNGTGDRVNENANHGKSLTGMLAKVAGNMMARSGKGILLGQLTDEQVGYHKANMIHIHKLAEGLRTPYCCGLDGSTILKNGLGTQNSTHSKPAKHYDVALDHLGTAIQIMANEFSGAIAYSGFDT